MNQQFTVSTFIVWFFLFPQLKQQQRPIRHHEFVAEAVLFGVMFVGAVGVDQAGPAFALHDLG